MNKIHIGKLEEYLIKFIIIVSWPILNIYLNIFYDKKTIIISSIIIIILLLWDATCKRTVYDRVSWAPDGLQDRPCLSFRFRFTFRSKGQMRGRKLGRETVLDFGMNRESRVESRT